MSVTATDTAIDHRRGCPDPQRLETFAADDPAGGSVTVTRCISCGEQLVDGVPVVSIAPATEAEPGPLEAA